MVTSSFLRLIENHKLNIEGAPPSRNTKEEIATAPCETCSNKVKCAIEELACKCYSVWLDSRTPKKEHSKIPNRAIYNRLFGSR